MIICPYCKNNTKTTVETIDNGVFLLLTCRCCGIETAYGIMENKEDLI